SVPLFGGAWEMRRQRYQPGIQNGPVAKRRTGSKNSATSKSFAVTRPSSRRHTNQFSNRLSNRPGRRRHDEGRGSSVMWMMILVGAAISAVFIFALRSQINTHRIAQAEERLKMKLDEYADQQKFLAIDQQRALNTTESDLVARRNGLDQLKLDRADPTSVIVKQVPPPLKSPQTGQKAAKVVKVVKSSAAKPSAAKPSAAKPSAAKPSAAKSPKMKARVVKAPIVK